MTIPPVSTKILPQSPGTGGVAVPSLIEVIKIGLACVPWAFRVPAMVRPELVPPLILTTTPGLTVNVIFCGTVTVPLITQGLSLVVMTISSVKVPLGQAGVARSSTVKAPGAVA